MSYFYLYVLVYYRPWFAYNDIIIQYNENKRFCPEYYVLCVYAPYIRLLLLNGEKTAYSLFD